MLFIHLQPFNWKIHSIFSEATFEFAYTRAKKHLPYFAHSCLLSWLYTAYSGRSSRLSSRVTVISHARPFLGSLIYDMKGLSESRESQAFLVSRQTASSIICCFFLLMNVRLILHRFLLSSYHLFLGLKSRPCLRPVSDLVSLNSVLL